MAELTCQACGSKQSQGYARQCTKCHRVLCDTCKGASSACKDSKHGTADCRGILVRQFVHRN